MRRGLKGLVVWFDEFFPILCVIFQQLMQVWSLNMLNVDKGYVVLTRTV